jgi:mono/diheme cytochrome c family protein
MTIWVALVQLPHHAIAEAGENQLKIIRSGKGLEVDPSPFNSTQLEQYGVFKQRCSQCHEITRPLQAVATGLSPVSHRTFGLKEIKRYVIKMMRKPNSGITKPEAKQIILFLRNLKEDVDKSAEKKIKAQLSGFVKSRAQIGF